MTAYELMMAAQKAAAANDSKPAPAPAPAPAPQTPLAKAVSEVSKAVAQAQELSAIEADILSKGMLVTFNCPIPGNDKVDPDLTRKVKENEHMGDDSGNWNKTVFPPSEYRTISKLAGIIRQWHYKNSLPWPMPGQQLLPSMKHDEYMRGMRDWKAQMEKARDAFIAALPQMREWAKKEHNGSYKAELYDEEKVRAKFRFDITLLPIPCSSHWVSTLRNVLGTDVEGVDDLVAEGMREAEEKLWERLETPIQSIINVLGKKEAGDRTKITEALIENVMAIAEQIPSLNINGNVKLAQLAADAKAAFAGYSKADLAEDSDKRKEALRRAEEISRRMKGI